MEIPTWGKCDTKFRHDPEALSALEKFVFDWAPAPDCVGHWRERLSAALDEAHSAGMDAANFGERR